MLEKIHRMVAFSAWNEKKTNEYSGKTEKATDQCVVRVISSHNNTERPQELARVKVLRLTSSTVYYCRFFTLEEL